ncbi:MAG: D-amino-acid oxidase [Litorilinea sp.]|nr:MAG: D-amino-acid oxidase [Litorilinea sp.]
MELHATGQRPHVVVVGAGIVGAAIAFHLAHWGLPVTVVDAGAPGQATTAVSFAWINSRDKNPRHYHDLNRRSLDMWDRFARRLGGDVGLTWGGELRWAATEAGAVEMANRVAVLQGWGYPIRLLSPAELKEREPNLTTGPVTAASFTEIDGHVETARVVAAALAGAEAHGARVLTQTRVTGFRRSPHGDQQRVDGVQTDQGEIPCDAVVLAAGPDTAALAALAGLTVPLKHTFGCTLLTDPLPPLFRSTAVLHTPRDADPMLNIRQLPDGRVMLHGGAHGGIYDEGSLGRTEEEVTAVLAAARRYLPLLADAEIQEVRRGRRPIPEDGLPILGFTRAVANLYLAAMHSGVTLAALVGELAALEIATGRPVDLLAPYRLERFQTT